MRKSKSFSKWGIFTFVSLAFVFSILILPTLVQAQVTAKIVGRVADADRDEYLPGANVYLEGTSFGSATDREGEFIIFNVPPGTYTLKVTYVGYEEYSGEVTVPSEGGFVGHDVANIKNVVAQEQMQRFPDLNTAEVLQRVPAISIERDQGEGRYVLIRGTEARLNAITINGERIASPENEERYVGLDVISTNQVASIEVTKALTPDMDADAIGGSVNLITKSAFDFDRRTLFVSAGAGYGDLKEEPLYQGDLSYSDLFGANDDWGFTINGNFYDSNRGSDNNEMEWGGEEDTSGTDIPWALRDLQLRDYTVNRFRYGVSGNLEYRPDNNNRYFVNAMYNQRDDEELRQRLRIRPDKGDYINGNEITEGAVERELKDRLERQIIYNVAGGGRNDFESWGIDYTVAYSYGKEDKPDEIDPSFELDEDTDLTLDLGNTDIPQYSITNLANGYEMDADNFTLDEISYEHNISTHSSLLGALNLKLPYSLAGYPAELKFGGKYYQRKKDRDNEVWTYGWEGADDILMSQLTAGDSKDEHLGGDYKQFGPLVDSKKSRDFFWANKDKPGQLEGELEYADTFGEKYKVDETIFSAYAMSTHNVSDWLFLLGLRYEGTNYDFNAYELVFDSEGDYESHSPVSGTGSENHILPNVQARYRLTPRSNLRLAFTSSLSRPNYYDHVPYFVINSGDEEIFTGNPDLKSTTAYNFDIFGEHYFQGLGVLAGGFFYKSLDKIIYRELTEVAGGPYDGFEQTQAVNGKSGWLYGLEINWNQQFTFLSGFWNGFGLYANYTWTNSEAELNFGRTSKLPGQSDHVGNFAIVYEKYGFVGRFSMNYNGKFIAEIGENEEEDLYYDDHIQWDFSASQKLYKGLRFYLEVVNINDAALRYYFGKTDRPVQREFYSWWAHVGLKYEL
jgi:TonB-dependent receptor